MKQNEIKYGIGADTLSKKGDVYTARKQHFYTFGKTVEQVLIEPIKKLFPNAVIIESGDHFAPFRGGAGVANSSHWYVKFSIPEVN